MIVVYRQLCRLTTNSAKPIRLLNKVAQFGDRQAILDGTRPLNYLWFLPIDFARVLPIPHILCVAFFAVALSTVARTLTSIEIL
jgi:hypothetical protein